MRRIGVLIFAALIAAMAYAQTLPYRLLLDCQRMEGDGLVGVVIEDKIYWHKIQCGKAI